MKKNSLTTFKEWDKVFQESIGRILKKEIHKTENVMHFIPMMGDYKCQALLIMTFHSINNMPDYEWRTCIQKMWREICSLRITELTLSLENMVPQGKNIEWCMEQIILLGHHCLYQMPKFKSKMKPIFFKQLTFLVDKAPALTMAKKTITFAEAVAAGMKITKDLGNTPPNICTPLFISSYCKKMAKQQKLTFKVMGEVQMRKLGMNAFLSVSQGSASPPQLVEMHHKPSKAVNKAPIVLIGKGVTFDTGGISIKPASSMDEMKYDMCGAGTVVGVMHAVAALKLPIHVIGLLAVAENMPSDTASRPGDVVTSMSGQTIEILNTDAEGRLVLCDTITYANRYKPSTVIDMATLTGACVVALGDHACGLYSNTPSLSQTLHASGEQTCDYAWPMPLHPNYCETLMSPIADMSNIGGRYAGSITAAYFLSKFIGDYEWAHLDIAGIAWISGQGKQQATARPVALLMHWLKKYVEDAK